MKWKKQNYFESLTLLTL